MPGIARTSTDAAQGIITGPGSRTVRANNKKVSIERDNVAGHGDSPHSAPRLTSNYSNSVFADGKKVAKSGTVATCGHTVSPGSSDVKVP
ncbi:MAG: hypothetical protein CMO97_01865 [Woeseia sp.]|nr:hypothetical protein [Woeseia sp.]|tara:strand:- start:909 stop:1178 length:270 start_codon:yes stop_codon:yes gene_type:complete